MIPFKWITALAISVLLQVIPAVQGQTRKPDAVKGRWAVLIGVDSYADLGKLRFAGNDQRSLAEQLVASGFPRDQVFLLHDKAAEPKYMPFRGNIERQLGLVLGLVDQGDLVIVGFSGHGVQLDGKSFLCPLDTRLDKLASTMIPLDDVYEQLKKCKASLKLLLVDACRNDVLPVGRRSVAVGRSLGDFAGAVEKPPEGILLLSSCGPGQVSMEDDQFAHGVFMQFILEGLRGKAADPEGSVSLAGLYNYASLGTKKYVARKFNDHQTPALRGEITGPFEIGRAEPAREITNSIGMKLMLIPAGEFLMGSSESPDSLAQEYRAKPESFTPELPQHRVTITKPFYLGAYAVTVGQFRRFASDTHYRTDAEKEGSGGHGYDASGQKWGQYPQYTWSNPGIPQTDDHPVVVVSWNDAVEFCNWLSRKEGHTYRLPTEAEREYACRAGTVTRYSSGDDFESLVRVGNVADAAARAVFPGWNHAITANDDYAYTSPVGKFQPNAFGLFDMHGNVYESCADWYNPTYYSQQASADPTGPAAGTKRVVRGGSWNDAAFRARCAARGANHPLFRANDTGFRVARSVLD